MISSSLRIARATLIAAFLPLAGALFATSGDAQGVPISAMPGSRSAVTLDLMPVPRSISLSSGRLPVDVTFRVAVIRHDDPRLQRAIMRMLPKIEQRTGLVLTRTVDRTPRAATLVIDCAGPGATVQSIDENESYTLDVTPTVMTLRAVNTVGVIRGLETVYQLVRGDSIGYYFPIVDIQDSPRFPWRGLLVDASRHFEPVESIHRTLDGMAAVKLNVLHWHLSDDQGFRAASERYPKLQGMGSDGLFYTRDQIREIVAYARDRGIRVVPEFDMPGHASSWFVGYPRYASAPGPYILARTWSRFTPVPVFDPTSEAVYRFVDRFIGDMTPLFPDAYWHIGGDEVNGRQWNENPRIQAFMKQRHLANNAALQTYFNQRMSGVLTRHHRHMVGWDEILHADLPRATVVQSWRGTKYLDEAVSQGFNGILSAPYYLDAMKSAATMYAADPIPVATPASPLPSPGLTSEQAARVLGGEACMWAELIDPATIDSRVWPRTAAIAERFWSPREVTDVDDMYRRLRIESVRLEQLGIDNAYASHSERFLRRIANGLDIAPMRDVVAFAEPVTLGQRVRTRPTTQMTPLVRIVDAAVPDPPSRVGFARVVDIALGSDASARAARDSLAHTFTLWRNLPMRVVTMADSEPLARGALPAARALAVAAEIGSAALDALSRGTPLPASWTGPATVTLDSLEKPQGLLHLTVIPPIRKLMAHQSDTSH